VGAIICFACIFREKNEKNYSEFLKDELPRILTPIYSSSASQVLPYDYFASYCEKVTTILQYDAFWSKMGLETDRLTPSITKFPYHHSISPIVKVMVMSGVILI